MRKVYIEFIGKVVLKVEDDEEISDIISECGISHPDCTRVEDYEINNWQITDSK